jgi:hypothetical protein
MAISQTELGAIRDRCAKARPVRWRTERNNFIKPELIPDDCRIVWSDDATDVAYITSQGVDDGNADAAFVAAARQDVPRLLAEVERLRDRLHEHGVDPDA